MIIQMAGLPGVGKSTLARVLGTTLEAPVLDKDRVRHAMFGNAVTYTREQDDLVYRMMLEATQHLLATEPNRSVVLDGRTCLRAYQVRQIRDFASALGHRLHIVECVCAPETAHRRIASDSDHPAADRTRQLHERLAAEADPITHPKILVHTDGPLEGYLPDVLTAVTAPPAASPKVPHHA